MKNCIRTAVVVFATLVCWSAIAAATWCGSIEPDPQHPLSWERLGPRVMAEVVRREYEAGYRIVHEEFLREFATGADEVEEVTAFRIAFDEYLQLRAREGDQPTRWRNEWDSIDKVEQFIFLAPAGGVQIVQLSCAELADPVAHAQSPRVAVAYAARALYLATGSDLAEGRRAAVRQAQAVNDAYENWLFNGLAQWPWELWLNGTRLSRDFTAPPPRSQWIALRPNASLVANFDSFEDSALDFALTFEPIGFVRYMDGSNYGRWWGISPMLTLTTDHGAGYGLLGRYNEFTVGAAYHERDSEVLWYFSVDLYRFVLGQQGRLRQAAQFRDELAQGLLRR